MPLQKGPSVCVFYLNQNPEGWRPSYAVQTAKSEGKFVTLRYVNKIHLTCLQDTKE